jgi:hypothetical protein
MDAGHNLDVMECWKPFNITDRITYIKQAMDAIKAETVGACWRSLWRECVNDFKGFRTIDNEVSFANILEEESEETLTNEKMRELRNSSAESEEDEQEIGICIN